jgi:hypothetical protein
MKNPQAMQKQDYNIHTILNHVMYTTQMINK